MKTKQRQLTFRKKTNWLIHSINTQIYFLPISNNPIWNDIGLFNIIPEDNLKEDLSHVINRLDTIKLEPPPFFFGIHDKDCGLVIRIL